MRISVFVGGSVREHEHVSKCDADLKVASGRFIYCGKTSIVELLVPNPPIRPHVVIYVPEKMPPREVPGCHFEEPQSATWRLNHKTVSFLRENFSY